MLLDNIRRFRTKHIINSKHRIRIYSQYLLKINFVFLTNILLPMNPIIAPRVLSKISSTSNALPTFPIYPELYLSRGEMILERKKLSKQSIL